jgi:tetrahydromethanopterin S-methyltransferase subunit G
MLASGLGGSFHRMNEFVTKGDFNRLATRVDVIEREVEGEKLVTRHILEQTRRNSDDLAAIKTRLDRVEEKVDGLDHKVDDLMKNLPRVVGDAIRDANRDSRRKR